MMDGILDDKAPHVIPFLLENLEAFQTRSDQAPDTPFFVGLNGVQGAGKSVLVSILRKLLESEPYNLPVIVFSLDDLYLTHEDQLSLARSHASNPLLQHRGQPSTHDVPLALSVFESLKNGQETRIPQYNKAAFEGQGDRVPEGQWETVNADHGQKIKVVLFEGWSVGFRPLADQALVAKHEESVKAAQKPGAEYAGRLGHTSLQSVREINDALRRYDAITDQLDIFIHIDAADPLFVYRWRLQQEHGLKAQKGTSMTDDEVKTFVDGYYPAYELYTDTLREGVFKPRTATNTSPGWWGRQMRLVVDAERQVTEVVRI